MQRPAGAGGPNWASVRLRRKAEWVFDTPNTPSDGRRRGGVFRVAPLSGETTSSLLCRLAANYGLQTKALRSCWQWRNYSPAYEGGGARVDAEVLLNTAGQEEPVPQPDEAPAPLLK